MPFVVGGLANPLAVTWPAPVDDDGVVEVVDKLGMLVAEEMAEVMLKAEVNLGALMLSRSTPASTKNSLAEGSKLSKLAEKGWIFSGKGDEVDGVLEFFKTDSSGEYVRDGSGGFSKLDKEGKSWS